MLGMVKPVMLVKSEGIYDAMCSKGREQSPHPALNQGYGVLNLHPDRNAKEPGSLVWQSEHTLNSSDDTLAQGANENIQIIGRFAFVRNTHPDRYAYPYFLQQ